MIKRFILLTLLLLLSGCNKIDVNTLNNKAKMLIEQGDYEGAISRLVSILDIAPNYPKINYNLAIAYYKKQDYKKAAEALQREIKIDPQFADAYYTLGTVYENLIQETLSTLKPAKTSFSHIPKNTVIQITHLYEEAIQNFKHYLKRTLKSDDKEKIITHIQLLEAEYHDFKVKMGR